MTTADTNQVDYWEISADKGDRSFTHEKENTEKNTLNQEDY